MATAVAPPVNGHVDAGKTDPHTFPVTPDNINACVREAQYAVRGEIVIRANQLAEKLRHGEDLGFDKVIWCVACTADTCSSHCTIHRCNIGNPQPLGQKPMTFIRQVLTLCDYPQVTPTSDQRPPPPPIHSSWMTPIRPSTSPPMLLIVPKSCLPTFQEALVVTQTLGGHASVAKWLLPESRGAMATRQTQMTYGSPTVGCNG